MENATKFGERLLNLREEREETQADLAKAIGITRQSLSRYETNERTPNIDLIFRVAKHYNVSADYLLGLSKVQSLDNDIQIACKVTGLTEESIKKLQEIKKLINGKTISSKYKEDVSNVKESIAYKSKELQLLFERNTGLNDKLDKYISSLPISAGCDANREKDELLEKAFLLQVSLDNAEDEIEMYQGLSINESRQYLKILNDIISNDNFFDFLHNVTVYILTDFSLDCTISSVITKPILERKETEDSSIDFSFSSKLIEKALLIEIQDYFKTLKKANAKYHLVDIDVLNDEKLEKLKSEIYGKEDTKNAQHNPTEE